MVAVHLEKKTIHTTAPQDFFIKNQGLAFQRTAARTRDVLLLYGSSELTDPIPNRASDYFSHEPSGFQVCPVGRAATTSLNVLQKLGALGSDLRGRKVAILLSPSSFLTPTVSPYSYAGNFSLTAASNMLFGNAVDWRLKTEISRRMSEFPDTLARSELLEVAVSCLTSGQPIDRLVLMAVWPLGKLQNIVLDLQDHFEALVYLLGERKPISRGLLPLFTAHNARTGKSKRTAGNRLSPRDQAASDIAFRARVATANEWIDLDLLFRTLSELKAQPLILAMPIDGSRYDAQGVSRSARQMYYNKLRKLAQRYQFSLIQFEDHDSDPSFLMAHREHPSPKGWMYYDRALDHFFHQTR